MRAGALKHRIVVEQNGSTQGATGGPIASWSEFASPRAAMHPADSRQVRWAQQSEPDVRHVFQVRGGMAYTDKMRVSFDGRIFDILSVTTDDGRSAANCPNNTAVYLNCTEGRAPGS